MKTVKWYGALIVALFTVAILWIYRDHLPIIGAVFIGVAGAFVVVGWFRFAAPLLAGMYRGAMGIAKHTMDEREQSHRQRIETEDQDLKRLVVQYAVTRNLEIEMSTGGTIHARAPRVQIVEDRPALPMPQQPALIAGPENECLNLSPDFRPHADTILSQRGMIVGISGSGKSNSMATLHEELGRLLVPFLLIDTENEYGSLCNSPYLPRGQRFDSSQVVPENAKDFGWNVIENHMQIVLDVSSYNPDDAAMVVVNTLAGLQEWEEEFENEDRVSFMVTLSEAGAWFPQSSKAVPYSDKAYNELQTSFFTNLVPRGRKRGLGLVFDLQRPAQVDKRLMQTSWKILHRQTESPDVALYKTLAGLERDEVISLGDGEAYVFSSQVSKHRVQIRRRYTQHEANTPGLASIKRRQYNLPEAESFGRNFDIPETPRNDFDRRVRPFRTVSEINTDELRNRQKGIPEGTKRAILDLYQSGKKRIDIQSALNLNGDEYWMIKQVCDEHDRQARRA